MDFVTWFSNARPFKGNGDERVDVAHGADVGEDDAHADADSVGVRVPYSG